MLVVVIKRALPCTIFYDVQLCSKHARVQRRLPQTYSYWQYIPRPLDILGGLVQGEQSWFKVDPWERRGKCSADVR